MLNICKLVLLACTSLLAACSSYDSNNSIDSSYFENKELISWNMQQPITLLPHQLKPIHYLEQNPAIKGLLVYHQVGTGKTYLALGFAERNPNMRIILVVPRFLKSHWQQNMVSYGVRNPARYEIISHSEAGKIANRDLQNSIVIIDESHKIISKIHSPDAKVADIYSQFYLNAKKAKRVLLLTGTPIYNHLTDVSYQVNLAAGKDLIPFNKADFRTKFMEVNKPKAALLGHYAESKMAPLFGTITGACVAIGVGSQPLAPVFILGGYFAPTLLKWNLSVKMNPLRNFNVKKLKEANSKYISYYSFTKKEHEFYPSKDIYYEDVSYNEYQTDYLMRFADGKLSSREISQLMNDRQNYLTNDYISINSSKLQEDLIRLPNSGLEIGNLLYYNPDNIKQVIYPEKFIRALSLMQETNGPVAVYSQFYYNGILLFKKFLESQGHKGKYAVLHPDLPARAYDDIIERYNKGKVKFLLIHPEITEGISLKGTRQMHLLETPHNKSFQEQIIGRAVRYKSHMHLPVSERHVDVHIWKPTFGSLNANHALALRENWARNYAEFNYYGERTIIDKHNHQKLFTPDDLAYENMILLDTSLQKLIELLAIYSIETK